MGKWLLAFTLALAATLGDGLWAWEMPGPVEGMLGQSKIANKPARESVGMVTWGLRKAVKGGLPALQITRGATAQEEAARRSRERVAGFEDSSGAGVKIGARRPGETSGPLPPEPLTKEDDDDDTDYLPVAPGLDRSLGPGADGDPLGDLPDELGGGVLRNGSGLRLPDGQVSSDRSGRWIPAYSTFYHPSLEWDGKCCLMADGLTEYHFNQSGYVAATGWPLYTILYVCGPSGKCLWLEVRDRGLLEPFVHLDISEVSAMTLSGLDYPSSIRELWIKEVWEP